MCINCVCVCVCACRFVVCTEMMTMICFFFLLISNIGKDRSSSSKHKVKLHQWFVSIILELKKKINYFF